MKLNYALLQYSGINEFKLSDEQIKSFMNLELKEVRALRPDVKENKYN